MLEKGKLNTIEVLISKALIDSFISHDEVFWVNNVLKEYYEMKEELKILKFLYNILYKYGWYKQKNVLMKWYRNNSR